MPFHIRYESDALLIVLEQDGEEPVTRRAVGGEQALLFAVALLIERRRLRIGDRLTVEADQ